MLENKREFDIRLYHKCDNKSKLAAIELMKHRGYELDGDIEKEHYKNYDLKFKHPITNEILYIENEYRGAYRKIRDVYDTVHIPIRKKVSKCDYYFVWGCDYNEVGIIKMSDILKFGDNPVNVLCIEAMKLYDSEAYCEDFIDVPKGLVLFLKKNKKGIWKKY